MKAIRVHEPGGPEVLRLEEAPEPVPKPNEALVRIEAAGLNFIDVYHRTGLYKVSVPTTLGQEGAGVVESVGTEVRDLRPGDRVAWADILGSYAEKIAAPAARLVRIPEGVAIRQAAAAMLQGMTAHYLACSTRPLEKGDACLIHAAAGGVGLLFAQVARMRGARVIGTVSTEEKALLASETGTEPIPYENFDTEIRRRTDGRGVRVVYDSVGRATWEKSLACLAPRGMLVLFGQSSGTVPPLDLQILARGGSLYLTRPSLGHYIASREELLERAGAVLGWVRDGRLKIRVGREYPLREAAEAHRALEARKTTGKTLLIP